MRDRYYVLYHDKCNDTTFIDVYHTKKDLEEWMNSQGVHEDIPSFLNCVTSCRPSEWHDGFVIIKGRVVIPHPQPTAIRWSMQDTVVERDE